MRTPSLGTVIWSAIAAGIVAGLAAAAFHFLATENVIDRAISLETLRRQAEGTYEEPMVSRELQKVGLFVGFLIYGLTWSLLFGGIFQAVQRWLPGSTSRRKGWFLVGAALWSVAVFPFLKIPANPPGVGDPDTITLRQYIYLAALVLGIVGTVVGLVLARQPRIGARWAIAAVAVFDLVVFLVLPNNPDVMTTSAVILWSFRGLSIAGLIVFWAVLGLVFGWLVQRRDAALALRPRPSAI